MKKLTQEQLNLFEQLHNSRLEDYKIFSKRDYRGVWSSIVDKYPESAHFIYELLQNADDAEATDVFITIKQSEMLFKHNGKKHFDISCEGATYVGDINSITGIGDSSKSDNQNKIGKFGVGFKAVFQYTNIPEIYDDTFKFKIENYIVPSLIENDHPEREEGETLFVFPYKEGRKSHDEIVSRLDNLQNPILFLSNLKSITIKVEGQTSFGDRILNYNKNCLETISLGDGITLKRYQLKEPRGKSTIFLFSKEISIAAFAEKGNHEIHVGFYYDEIKRQLITDTKQNIFCFFPTKETFNTCFVSHAPFLLTDNRQNLKPNETLNLTLTEALANLAAKSVTYLRNYGIKNNNLIINENITEIIPKYTKNFWEQLDPVLETPIYKAFNNLMKNEKILLSRNNEYLNMNEAYIGTPRELIELLSREQFCELRGVKGGVDFLKWDLILNVNKNKVGILNDIREYTSEDFARDITAEFMAKQEIKWVTKMYTFLRSAAPKLWKLIGNDKSKGNASLPFRYAPIVKNHKGEWIPPYLAGNKPNIFLPIKKSGSSTSDNTSDYNFIHQEYLEDDMAQKFFEELEIQEPNEYDYIRTVVLEKYVNDDLVVNSDDLISDLDVLIGYYRKNPRNLYDFINLIKDTVLLAINKDEDEELWVSKPNEIYYPSKRLETYFRREEVWFLDFDFYKTLIEKYGETVFSEFVKQLGVKDKPEFVIRREEYTRLYNPSVIQQIDVEGVRFEIYDYELRGFKYSIISVTKEQSLYIWNELLPKIDFSNYGNLLAKVWKKYARKSEDAYYQSTFKYLLKTEKWIFDEKGDVFSAEEIALERLAPEYDRGNGLIAFLGIEKKEKSIIELGGTEEQQNQLDLGKRVRDLAGDELSEQEIMQAVAEAKAKKRNSKQPPKTEIPVDTKTKTFDIESSSDSIEENIEEKLNKKWEEKSKSKISRPSHVSSQDKVFNGDISGNIQNDSAGNDQPFFDTSKNNFNRSEEERNNVKAEKKIKTRDTEAQENAQAAHEQVQILELLNNTETYTYKWFKLLMELMHANKSLKTDRHIQLDFSEWEIQCSDKILHLSNPTAPVPTWLTDSDQVVISSLGEKPEKVSGQIVKCDEYSVDIALDTESNIGAICKNAKKFRLIADNTTNIIDSLEKRFLQLGFEDEYNLNENLTQNIHFIYGPPGTGKTTTLVKSVHDIIEGANKKTNILVLTPTNKAADVIAEKMVNDNLCYDYLSRFGATEKLYLIEDAAVVTNRDSMDMDLLPHNIVVTTAARYTYDCLQPDNVFLCDYDWDYIYVDEASMVDLVTITYILYKGAHSKIIIAGDPKQIEPVSQNDMPTYNVYDLVGLHGFADAINNYKRYPVTSLTTQYRSIPSIGEIVSKFAYNGIVKTDPQRKPQKQLNLNGLSIKDINFIGFEIVDLDLIKGLSAVGGSAFHLYSSIFTYNLAEYIVKQIGVHNLGNDYSIGIVCPYRAQADAIKQMIDSRPISSENCTVTCGTVHSFQGDECDIMLIVLNPPINCSQGSHINNENIMNVAMSRARDYLFFILPSGQTPGFTIKNVIGSLTNKNDRAILRCSEVENVIFGTSDYIANNTHVTCHMPVNVYCEESAVYEVRMSDTAIDIKINKG